MTKNHGKWNCFCLQRRKNFLIKKAHINKKEKIISLFMMAAVIRHLQIVVKN